MSEAINIILKDVGNATFEFVEIEDDYGKGIDVGKWMKIGADLWSIRVGGKVE